MQRELEVVQAAPLNFTGWTSTNFLRHMSDCEHTDFFWEPWISPGKKKRKKESKNIKGPKCKSNTTMKTKVSIQKKKKNKKNKFRDKTEGRKDKKKVKNKMCLNSNDGSSAVSAAQAKPEAPDPRSTERLQSDLLTQDIRKKTKRRKEVKFEMSPRYIRVKRPKFASSSPQTPVLETESVRDNETEQSRGQTHRDDSQCTADDINSQDLFITQKTFRRSPSDTSSGEASDKAGNSAPQPFTQRDRVLTEGSQQASGNPKKKKNSYLEEPIVLNVSSDVAMSKKHSCNSSQQAFSPPLQTCGSSLIPQTSTVSVSTQTENFFTAELSSFLLFGQRRASSIKAEALKPLDLSLPKRARKDLRGCVRVTASVTEHKRDKEKHGDWSRSRLQDDFKGDVSARPPCSSKVKKEPCDGQRLSVGADNKGETTPSPQSESDHKSVDTTTSSEDNEQLWRSSKAELIQVKVVQTRLNESFFFKTKGETHSPRPESPLMKMAQGRDLKSRKGR